jgi:hypothetical protein
LCGISEERSIKNIIYLSGAPKFSQAIFITFCTAYAYLTVNNKKKIRNFLLGKIDFALMISHENLFMRVSLPNAFYEYGEGLNNKLPISAPQPTRAHFANHGSQG